MDKVTSLSECKPLEVEEAKEKEMELADVSFFDGKISEEVTNDDLEEMYALAQEMVKFAHARNGAGLTLPQIGILKRGFVFLSGDNKWEMMLNPEFFATGKKSYVYERSLSYEGTYAFKRFKKINAVYYSIEVDKNDRLCMKKRYKTMSSLKAFMFQSLVDSLNGKTGMNSGIKISESEE